MTTTSASRGRLMGRLPYTNTGASRRAGPSQGAVAAGSTPWRESAAANADQEPAMGTASREVHLASTPESIPVPENFAIVEAEVPDPGPSEVLVRNLFMSVDPAMRPRLAQAKPGTLLGGGALGKIERSNHASLQVGQYVLSQRGFREWFV